jgi:hypothetical protein
MEGGIGDLHGCKVAIGLGSALGRLRRVAAAWKCVKVLDEGQGGAGVAEAMHT